MKESYRDGVSHQAVDTNQLLDLLSGYGVIAGGEVTEGADPYHVEVESANAYFNGDTQSPGSTTIDLQSYVDSFNPRKCLICVNDSGSYEVREGEPEQAKPRGNIRFQTNRPAYPDLHDVTGVIPLAGVWLGSSAEDIVNDDIEDRRRSPDVTLRNVTVENLIARTGITDGAGVDHEGELADSSDVTDTKIQDIINSDTDHGSSAPHNYFTDVDARDAVEENTDAADLSGEVGSDGQHLVTDGTNPFWQDMPGPENNQSLDTGDDVTFNSVTQQDATVNNQITWPDGTVTTTSPEAQANNITQLPELGDVSVGTLTNRQTPDGTQGWYFTTDSNGVFYDNGTWDLIAEHPANIDPGDLPFDPAFKSDSVTVNAGNLLNNGGQVSIGNSITIDVDEPALVNALDDDYVADSDLDGLAITHGGDSLDGTYTIPQGDAIELNNGWQLTDDGSGNLVLNKGSGDGYEVRAVKDSNGNTALEIDGLQLATESFANSTFIKQSNEGNLDVSSADTVPGSGVNGTVASATDATNLTGGTSEWKVENGTTVNGDHPDFSSAQQAINFADNNGYERVEFGDGVYGPITIDTDGMTIEGVGPHLSGTRFNASGRRAVIVQSDAVTLKNVGVAMSTSNDNTAFEFVTGTKNNKCMNCHAHRAGLDGYHIRGSQCVLWGCSATTGNIARDSVRLHSNSSDSIVHGCPGIGNITDDGTGNKVDNNT